jgi:cobalt-zinc-cadmium efflux system membrane fusion protein
VTLPPNAPQLAKLRIEKVLFEDVETDEVSAPGSLETNPNRVAHATLPVAGRITSVAVKLGDSVQEGQTLLTLESPEVDTAELAFPPSGNDLGSDQGLGAEGANRSRPVE